MVRQEKGNWGKAHLDSGNGHGAWHGWVKVISGYISQGSGQRWDGCIRKEKWASTEPIGRNINTIYSQLGCSCSGVHYIDEGRWGVRGHSSEYLTMVLSMRVRSNADQCIGIKYILSIGEQEEQSQVRRDQGHNHLLSSPCLLPSPYFPQHLCWCRRVRSRRPGVETYRPCSQCKQQTHAFVISC